MKKLHKYILLTYLRPLLATTIIVLFIFTLWFLYRYIDELVGKGLSASVIAELLFYNANSNVPLALPVAILFASLIGFGNLTEFSELTAIKASGISLLKALKSAIIAMVFICIIAFYFANTIAPHALLKMGALIYDLRQKKDAFALRQGVFYNGINNYSIFFNKNSHKNNILQDIIIYKGNGNELDLIRAQKGIIVNSPNNDKLLLKLYNGNRYFDSTQYNHTTNKKSYEFNISSFAEYMQVIPLSGFTLHRTPTDYFKNAYQILNSQQLNKKITEEKGTINKNIAEKMDYFFASKDIITQYNNLIDKPNYITINTRPLYLKSLNYLFKKNTKIIKEIILIYIHNKDAKSPIYAINFPINIKLLNNAYSEVEYNIKISIQQLEALAIKIDDINKDIRYYKVEIYKKLTLASSCIILFFIGAPLAFIIHRGGIGIPLITSVLFFLLFYALNMTGEKLSKTGVLQPIIGMWLPVLVLFTIAMILTYLSIKEIKPNYIISKLSYYIKRLYSKN